MISTAPAPTAVPMSTRTVVARPRVQPSANGVSHSTSGSSWVINAISSPVKITEVIAGGIAPSRNIRGRRVIRLKPLVSNPAPVANSVTADRTIALRLVLADQVLRVGPDGGSLGLGCLPKLILEIKHLLTQAGIAGREDAYGQESGVPGIADGDSCDRHSSRHLND